MLLLLLFVSSVCSMRCFLFDSAHIAHRVTVAFVRSNAGDCVCVFYCGCACVCVCMCRCYGVYRIRSGLKYSTQCVVLLNLCAGMRTTQFSWDRFFLVLLLLLHFLFHSFWRWHECVACVLWRRRRKCFRYSMVTYLYGFFFLFMWYGRQILFEWVQLSSIADAVRNIQKSFHHFHSNIKSVCILTIVLDLDYLSIHSNTPKLNWNQIKKKNKRPKMK